jgi:hypothetical protein
MWKGSNEKFHGKIESGFYQERDGIVRGKNVDGSPFEVSRQQVDYWMRRVNRLDAEAKRQLEAQNWHWFDWLGEYAGMVRETEAEHWEDRYTAVISFGVRQQKSLMERVAKAAAARRKIGDKTAVRVKNEIARGESRLSASPRQVQRLKKKKLL